MWKNPRRISPESPLPHIKIEPRARWTVITVIPRRTNCRFETSYRFHAPRCRGSNRLPGPDLCISIADRATSPVPPCVSFAKVGPGNRIFSSVSEAAFTTLYKLHFEQCSRVFRHKSLTACATLEPGATLAGTIVINRESTPDGIVRDSRQADHNSNSRSDCARPVTARFYAASANFHQWMLPCSTAPALTRNLSSAKRQRSFSGGPFTGIYDTSARRRFRTILDENRPISCERIR